MAMVLCVKTFKQYVVLDVPEDIYDMAQMPQGDGQKDKHRIDRVWPSRQKIVDLANQVPVTVDSKLFPEHNIEWEFSDYHQAAEEDEFDGSVVTVEGIKFNSEDWFDI